MKEKEIRLSLQFESQNNLYNVFCPELDILVTDKNFDSAVSQLKEIAEFNASKLVNMNGSCPDRLKARREIASQIVNRGIDAVKFVLCK